MKEFQSIILKFVKNHERHKKYLAFLMALSIMVSFAVPFSLIMPAISMTAEDAQYADDMPTMYSASGKESHTTRQHPHGPARPILISLVWQMRFLVRMRMVIRQRILQIILHQHQFGW